MMASKRWRVNTFRNAPKSRTSALVEFGRSAGDPGNAPDRRSVTVAEVVENDDVVPRLASVRRRCEIRYSGAPVTRTFISIRFVCYAASVWRGCQLT